MIMDNKITIKGITTWMICTLFFMYEFLLRTMMGTFQPQLMHDLDLTSVQFALLSTTVFQLIYATMQIPIGVILDQLGIKKTLLIAAILCTIANLGFSLTHNFTIAIMFRMLMGLGSSCGFICLLVATYDWMPRKNSALFIGISQFIATLGPMLAAGPLRSLADSSITNWQQVFFILSLIGGVISILTLLYVDNNRQQRGKFIILARSSSILINLLHLIKQKRIWFIAIYSAFVYFSIEYLTENEGVAFLVKKGFSSTFSAYMITIAWLGYAIGCPLLGYFSDKIQRRKPFMVACSLMVLTSLMGIIYIPLNNEWLMICFALLGMGSGGSIIGFTTMAEQCKENSLAAGLGLNNTMIVLTTALTAPLIGHVLSRVNANDLLLSNYQNTFMIIMLFALGALVIALFGIKETFCKSTCENTILKSKLQSGTNALTLSNS